MRGKQGARRGGRRAVVGGHARGEKGESEPPDGELRVLGVIRTVRRR
jgi:hypothetical protein